MQRQSKASYVCPQCGAAFTDYQSNGARRFCTTKCYRASQQHPVVSCACGCGTPVQGLSHGKPKRFAYAHNMRMGPRNPFWQRVDQTKECWEWTGPRTPLGYGMIRLRTADGTFNNAHRYAYYLAHGKFPTNLFVCHRCDNPPCCRPDHLFLGTNSANVADMVQKDRHTPGVRNGNAKLTAANVAEIKRRLASETQAAVARAFGVSSATMSLIANGKRYR